MRCAVEVSARKCCPNFGFGRLALRRLRVTAVPFRTAAELVSTFSTLTLFPSAI
jgi:hypothetical protein